MGRLQFFIDALVTLLHDGETGFLGIRDGEGGAYLRDVHVADFLAHRVLAIHAVRQRSPVYRAHQFKALAAHAARSLRVFRIL